MQAQMLPKATVRMSKSNRDMPGLVLRDDSMMQFEIHENMFNLGHGIRWMVGNECEIREDMEMLLGQIR